MKHTNSKGVEYTLYKKGHLMFFARENKPDREEIDLPDDKEIGENERTGMLFVRNKK